MRWTLTDIGKFQKSVGAGAAALSAPSRTPVIKKRPTCYRKQKI